MKTFRRIRELAHYYNPVSAFRKSHAEQPNPIWMTTAQSPFEVAILAYFSVLGLLTFFNGILAPMSVSEIYPWWLILGWSGAIGFGSLVALIGRYFQYFRTEATGLVLFAAAAFVFVVAIIMFTGQRGIFASGAYLAIGTACLIRIRVLALARKSLRVADRIVRENDRNDNGSAQ